MISPEYAKRFLAAADAGPAPGTGARQLPIWCEMAWVMGFEVGSVEPVPGHPTLFIAEAIDTGCACASAGICQERPATVIDGDPLCARHAELARAENARVAIEDANATQARRAQLAYDREIIRRIEAMATDETRFVRSVRS